MRRRDFIALLGGAAARGRGRSQDARNLSAFKSNAKKQVESLAGQLREEKDLRADADKEIDRTLREHSQGVEKRLRTMSDQLGQQRDLADRLTQEAHALRHPQPMGQPLERPSVRMAGHQQPEGVRHALHRVQQGLQSFQAIIQARE